MSEGDRGPDTDAVTEVEVTVTTPTVPCVAATTELGGEFELEEIIPRGDGSYGEYYSVRGIDPDDLLEYAAAHEASEAQFLSREDEGGLLEMVVTGDCPAMSMAERGALPRAVRAAHGVCRIVSEVPPQYDETSVTAGFLNEYPEAELVAKREKSYVTPLFSHRQFDQAVDDHLTERQREVLEMAHRRGYYDWPRKATQEELADELGITTSTFTQHLRSAEQKLIAMVFEDGDLNAGAAGATRRA